MTLELAFNILLSVLGALLLLALTSLMRKLEKLTDKVMGLDTTVAVIAVELGAVKAWRDRRAAAAGNCDKESML